jgi:hypothetical protein
MGGSEYGVSVRTLTVVVYVVTAAWAGNIFAPLFISTYQGNAGVNGIMGAVIGLLGAARYQASRSRARLDKEQADDGNE